MLLHWWLRRRLSLFHRFSTNSKGKLLITVFVQAQSRVMQNSRSSTGRAFRDRSRRDSGKFYPADCKSPEARLRYCAAQFPMVEVDARYYAIAAQPRHSCGLSARQPTSPSTSRRSGFSPGTRPIPRCWRRIREAMPPSPKRMLYYRDVPPDTLDELWRRFRLALEPLALNGELTAVHFQFPPWVINDRDGRARLVECIDRVAGHQLTVEFRNQLWFEGVDQAPLWSCSVNSASCTPSSIRQKASRTACRRSGTSPAPCWRWCVRTVATRPLGTSRARPRCFGPCAWSDQHMAPIPS